MTGLAESREAIRLEPKSAIAHTHLGIVLVSKGELEKAIAESSEDISPEVRLRRSPRIVGQCPESPRKAGTGRRRVSRNAAVGS